MDLLVGRQPILDRQQHTVAYELLFRSGTANQFDGSDGNSATSTVIANTFLSIGCTRVLAGKRGFINFPRQFLLEDGGFLLPRQRVVIEILENVEPDAQVLEACGRLKAAGYALALDDVVETAPIVSYLAYAEFAKIELPVLVRRERRRLCRYFLDRGLRVVAEKVETREDFENALGDGCELFQGYFFACPEIVSGREVPVSKMACLRLISEVQRPELDFGQLERIVRLDIGLTHKLLCLVNSAAFARPARIDAIGPAFVSLGERNIRKWVTLAALPALASGRPAELVTASLVRARFCELAAESLGMPANAPTFFLTGLLSLLDAMIGRPLEELAAEMGLDRCVADAILSRPGACDRLGRALAMATAFERSDFKSVERLTAEAGMAASSAAELYVQAISWADDLPR
jgi:EAL and modified HD-GYP domain-containing signal transduction protein